jgi:hypothetical protein
MLGPSWRIEILVPEPWHPEHWLDAPLFDPLLHKITEYKFANLRPNDSYKGLHKSYRLIIIKGMKSQKN